MESDHFGVMFEKTAFKVDGLRKIRWGIFYGVDGQPRIAAFLVSLVDASIKGLSDEQLNEQAEKVIKKPETLAGPTHQAYEWHEGEFYMVDANAQQWFKFNN